MPSERAAEAAAPPLAGRPHRLCRRDHRPQHGSAAWPDDGPRARVGSPPAAPFPIRSREG
jgi:hypothetical protein